MHVWCESKHVYARIAHTVGAEHHQSPVGARRARGQREVAHGHRAPQLACADRRQDARVSVRCGYKSKRGVGDRAASGTGFLHFSICFLGKQYKMSVGYSLNPQCVPVLHGAK